MASAMLDTPVSRPGSMPRTMAPLMAGGRLSIASVSRNGAAPTSSGAPFSCSMRRRQSTMAPPPAFKLAWADTLSNRSRSSEPSPFMTDSTTIKMATPRATPSSDTHVMKETKKPCSRASE